MARANANIGAPADGMTIQSPQYDWLRRAARTFLQAFVGTLSVMAIPALNDIIRAIGSAEPYELDFAFWQSVLIAASLAGVVSIISAAQNALEDKGTMPALMKGKASSGKNPVPEPDVGWQNPDTWPSTPIGGTTPPKRDQPRGTGTV